MVGRLRGPALFPALLPGLSDVNKMPDSPDVIDGLIGSTRVRFGSIQSVTFQKSLPFPGINFTIS
jgi:hypothetical protein